MDKIHYEYGLWKNYGWGIAVFRYRFRGSRKCIEVIYFDREGE